MANAYTDNGPTAKLHALLSNMFDLVDEQLATALNAAFLGDEDLALQVQQADDRVDAMEIEIDQVSNGILADGSLNDVDRRLVITAIKVNTDLERIGDHAKNIAKEVSSDMPLPRSLFEEMVDAARSILYDSQDALVHSDRTMARRVITHERNVNDLHKATVRSAVSQTKNNPDQAASMAHLIGVSKSLERIADHATNIAESVVFWVEGIDVRHPQVHSGDSGKGKVKLNDPASTS